jgi:hypothetical protein
MLLYITRSLLEVFFFYQNSLVEKKLTLKNKNKNKINKNLKLIMKLLHILTYYYSVDPS